MDTEALQFAFFVDGYPGSAAEVWQAAFNTFPPNAQAHTEQHTSASGGGFGTNMQLELQCQTGRIDLFVTQGGATPGGEASSPQPLVNEAGAIKLVIESACAVSDGLLMQVLRAGFVMHRVEIVQTMDQAHDSLKTRLPFLVIKDGSSDIDFRTNVPATLPTSPPINVNRIARWNSATRAFFGIIPNPGNVIPGFGFQTQLAAAENIDINTVPGQDMSGVDPKIIVNELVNSAKKIADGGYDAL